VIPSIILQRRLSIAAYWPEQAFLARANPGTQDPFATFKRNELHLDAVATMLARALLEVDALTDPDPRYATPASLAEAIALLLHYSLGCNQVCMCTRRQSKPTVHLRL